MLSGREYVHYTTRPDRFLAIRENKAQSILLFSFHYLNTTLLPLMLISAHSILSVCVFPSCILRHLYY